MSKHSPPNLEAFETLVGLAANGQLPEAADVIEAAGFVRPATGCPSKWSRTFHKVRSLADAAGLCRASIYNLARDGRIHLRRVVGGWQVRLDDLPADTAARLQ